MLKISKVILICFLITNLKVALLLVSNLLADKFYRRLIHFISSNYIIVLFICFKG